MDVTSEVWDDNWDACSKRHSYIVRCPYPYIPCEDMWEGKKDFKCGLDCTSKGGKRQTCNGGKNHLNFRKALKKGVYKMHLKLL